jgi:hypothetical protein
MTRELSGFVFTKEKNSAVAACWMKQVCRNFIYEQTNFVNKEICKGNIHEQERGRGRVYELKEVFHGTCVVKQMCRNCIHE